MTRQVNLSKIGEFTSMSTPADLCHSKLKSSRNKQEIVKVWIAIEIAVDALMIESFDII
jgi:hypothetical protein